MTLGPSPMVSVFEVGTFRSDQERQTRTTIPDDPNAIALVPAVYRSMNRRSGTSQGALGTNPQASVGI
jgi:hypothetical protein